MCCKALGENLWKELSIRHLGNNYRLLIFNVLLVRVGNDLEPVVGHMQLDDKTTEAHDQTFPPARSDREDALEVSMVVPLEADPALTGEESVEVDEALEVCRGVALDQQVATLPCKYTGVRERAREARVDLVESFEGVERKVCCYVPNDDVAVQVQQTHTY